MVTTKGVDMSKRPNRNPEVANQTSKVTEPAETVNKEAAEQDVLVTESAETVDESPEHVNDETFIVVRVTGCQKLRVRKTPTDKENNVLKIIPAGKILKVKKYNADWSEIIDNGGFVMSKFVAQV